MSAGSMDSSSRGGRNLANAGIAIALLAILGTMVHSCNAGHDPHAGTPSMAKDQTAKVASVASGTSSASPVPTMCEDASDIKASTCLANAKGSGGFGNIKADMVLCFNIPLGKDQTDYLQDWNPKAHAWTDSVMLDAAATPEQIQEAQAMDQVHQHRFVGNMGDAMVPITYWLASDHRCLRPS